MDSCAHFRELISAFIDGELTSEEEIALRTHLQNCPDCAQWHAMFSLLHEETAHLTVEPPPELKQRITQSLQMMSKKGPSLFSRFKFTAVAAAIVLVVFAASGSLQKYFPHNQENPMADASPTFESSLEDIPMTISELPKEDSAGNPQTRSSDIVPNSPSSNRNTQQQTDDTSQKNERVLSKKTTAKKIIKHSAKKESKVTSKTQQEKNIPANQIPSGNTSSAIPPSKETDSSSSHTPPLPTPDSLQPPVNPDTPSTNEPSKDKVESEFPADSPSSPETPQTSPTETPDSSDPTLTEDDIPPIPYQEEFSFIITLRNRDIPESLKNQTAQLYQNNLYFIVSAATKTTILNDMKSNNLVFHISTGKNSNLEHGLIILMQS